MRSRNRKVNSIGRAGCLGLLALGLMLANPIAISSAFAEEIPEDEETLEEMTEDDITVLADTPSAVTISFSPSAGSASLTPTTSAGQSAQIKVLAAVSVQKSGGYSVYVKSNSQNLVGVKSSSNTIPGLQGSATYANIPVNSWGYYATEGSVIPDNATYKAVSTTGNGDKITENTSNKITSDTKTIALSFAAKINDQKPADTYQNTVTMSVVSSPMKVTLAGISTMQEMTSDICGASTVGDTEQLKDTRDNKYYWVKKMPDNQCWMVQNLDLDITSGLSAFDTDISSDWNSASVYPPTVTADKATSSTVDKSLYTSVRSWSLGDYVITNPEVSSSCSYPKTTLGDCASQFSPISGKISSSDPDFYKKNHATINDTNYDSHYLAGNYYSWNAATAGTGGAITSGQASGSICPKGWKLPTGNNSTSGSFAGLISAGAIGNDVSQLTGEGFFFVRNGGVSPDYMLESAGQTGNYWSSSPSAGNEVTAYYLMFEGSSSIQSIWDHNRYRNSGFAVRCIAR